MVQCEYCHYVPFCFLILICGILSERVADAPIPGMWIPEQDKGLWGGEEAIKGYWKPRKFFQAGVPYGPFIFSRHVVATFVYFC
jgi:hypothetical protein